MLHMVFLKHSYQSENTVGLIEEEKRHIWEHERFVYHLRMVIIITLKFLLIRLHDIDPITYLNRDPNPIDVIELQVQQNLNRDTSILNKDSDFAIYESTSTSQTNKKGNIHFYLSGSSGYKSRSINNVPLFDSNRWVR